MFFNFLSESIPCLGITTGAFKPVAKKAQLLPFALKNRRFGLFLHSAFENVIHGLDGLVFER